MNSFRREKIDGYDARTTKFALFSNSHLFLMIFPKRICSAIRFDVIYSLTKQKKKKIHKNNNAKANI
jgi:hypothetical protein